MSPKDRSNGNFDPPWEAVVIGLDNLAKSCGWKNRAAMRVAVLRSKGYMFLPGKSHGQTAHEGASDRLTIEVKEQP